MQNRLFISILAISYSHQTCLTPSVFKTRGKKTNRTRQSDRETETGTRGDRETERQRDKERDIESERERQTDIHTTHTHRHRHTDKQTHIQTHRQTRVLKEIKVKYAKFTHPLTQTPKTLHSPDLM